MRKLTFFTLVLLWVMLRALFPAHADSLVVTTCGSLPQAYGAGSTRLETIDVNGNRCIGGTLSLAGSTSNASSGVATSATNLPTVSYNYLWNGVSWDQAPGTVANGAFTQGAVASGAADAGNPVKVAGRFNTTQPTFTDGQRGDIQLDTRGNLKTVLFGQNSVSSAGVATANDAVTNPIGLNVNAFNALLNGTNFDRAFTCPNTAVVNVTAAATTQIVALSGSTNIRVCSFAISMSAAGTAQFVSGTGSNCGTGTANITGAMTLATGTPLAMSSGNGSVFRAGASQALCLSAVTGNVTGFVTYAQF